MRAVAVALAFDVPGIQIYLFRRTFPEISTNHLTGSMNFHEMLAPFIETGQVKIVENMIRFSHGSTIQLHHAEHDNSVLKLLGAEINVLLIDELTSFSYYQYTYLRSRVRLGGLKVPPEWKHKLPFILCATNPGGVGHQWVKGMFINNAKPLELCQMPPGEGGMLRQFIPAKLSDNKTLMENDPNYAQRLMGLGNPALVRAMLEGDWDIVAGAALEKLAREKHIIRHFDIPKHWTKFSSIDWGTSAPYAIGWYAVVEDDLLLKAKDEWPERLVSRGSLIMYRECYGTNGHNGQGSREEAFEVARRMHALEARYENISYRIGDSAMWASHDGPSAAENMMNELSKLENPTPHMEQSRKGRMENYLEVRNRIAAETGYPGFYTFDNCPHFWRTVPELQLDIRNPEKGPDSRQEDHHFDQLSYAFASRPLIMDKKTYEEEEYDRARRRAKDAELGVIGNNTSRYS